MQGDDKRQRCRVSMISHEQKVVWANYGLKRRHCQPENKMILQFDDDLRTAVRERQVHTSISNPSVAQSGSRAEYRKLELAESSPCDPLGGVRMAETREAQLGHRGVRDGRVIVRKPRSSEGRSVFCQCFSTSLVRSC